MDVIALFSFQAYHCAIKTVAWHQKFQIYWLNFKVVISTIYYVVYFTLVMNVANASVSS